MPGQTMFSISEVIAIIGGVLGGGAVLISFLVKRSVFLEIDALKSNKQDKPMCEERKKLCSQETITICNDIQKINETLKEENREFKILNRKVDRLMGAMKVRFDDLNGD